MLRLERGRRVSDGGSAAETMPGGAVAARVAGEAIARAHGITKSYRRGEEIVHAVMGVSVELRSGELVALVGRSGSGKSTLLNILAGWQRPDAGDLSYSVAGVVQSDPARLGWDTLAVLPQKFGLMEELSVRGNVEYPARLAGSLAERRAWIDSILADLELDELADRLPQEISVGQQQRTALARALALAPAVLLADEPTAHQDSPAARRGPHAAATRGGVGHVLRDRDPRGGDLPGRRRDVAHGRGDSSRPICLRRATGAPRQAATHEEALARDPSAQGTQPGVKSCIRA